MYKQSRRHFLQTSVTGIGAAAATSITRAAENDAKPSFKLPREIWIAAFGQHGMKNDDPALMIETTLQEMNRIIYYKPDIICLPETFPYAHFYTGCPAISELAEQPLGPITGQFAEFAKNNKCYLICPLYTKHDGYYYNAAVVINREGQLMGEYRKIHPTEGEIDDGITPGPLDPPVFQTDFGIIGIQICFDINWQDGWEALRKKGAEIIFWPSAFGGGQQVNTKAWQNKCCVVASTFYGISKICDIDGTDIITTGHWSEHWAIGSVNLEKVFLHTWPYVQKFPDIEKKYGRHIRIKNYHEEEWTILESLSPDIEVSQILKEFDIKIHEEHIASGESKQKKYRPAI